MLFRSLDRRNCALRGETLRSFYTYRNGVRRSALPRLLSVYPGNQFVIDFPRSFRFIHSDDEGFTICRQYDKFRCLCVGIQRVRAKFVIAERTQGKPRRAEAVRPHAGIQIAAIFDRIDFGIREAQIRPPGRVNCQCRIAAACLHAAGKQQQRRAQQRHADKDGSHSGRYFVEVR